MIVTFLLTCLFLALLHHYIVHFGRKGRLINRIPGLKTLPIIGNVHQAWRRSPEELWHFSLSVAKTYYPITRVWTLTIPSVFIFHPDDVEKILGSTKHKEKSFPYKLLHPWLGDGLLISKGIKWQKRRKMLTPSFHFSILKQFVEILVEEGNHAAKSLINNREESIIDDLLLFTSHHTLNAICETSMGISLQNAGHIQQKYRQTVHNMGKIIFNRLFKPWFLSDTIFGLTSMGRVHEKYLNILHSFTTNIIAERKLYHKQTGGQYLKHFESDTGIENEEILGIKKRRMAMLDILIAESRHSGLSDSDIREEVDTFMFEGHDTVAVAASFSLLLLAEHKDVQDRVRKEINKVMEENGKLDMNVLQNLSYLEMCIKESLRMYSSVPFISHVCTEDVKLQSYLVPEGTPVHIFIYYLHHNPKFWPNPEVFDPDRFLSKNIKNRHPYSYLPFSAGPRNCIGQRFAMLELKALIAPLVYNFYLEPVDYLKDVKIKADFILRTTHPIRMKVIPIKRAQSSNVNTDS